MRKKAEQPVDIAAITAAWDEFFNNECARTKEDIGKDGWKCRKDLLALNKGHRVIRELVKSDKLEKKIFLVKFDKISRKVEFYRPKL